MNAGTVLTTSISAIKETLQRKFDLISEVGSNADFYLEVSSYILLILSNNKLKPIVDRIKQEERRDLEELNLQKEKLLQKLSELKGTLQEIVGSAKVVSATITQQFQRFDDLQSGKIQTSEELWRMLEDALRNVCRELISKHQVRDFSQIATIERGKLLFSKDVEELTEKTNEEFKTVRKFEKVAIWGAWNRLYLIPVCVYTKESELRKLLDKDFMKGYDLALLMSEMERIINPPIGIQQATIHFKRDKECIDLRRLHNYVLDQLEGIEVVLTLLRRYKQKCEWYKREVLLEQTATNTKGAKKTSEKNLTRELCLFLHDNNFLPLSEVILGDSRPDIIANHAFVNLVPIEVKVIRNRENHRIKTGFNQILTYLRTIDVSEGFYVIFCRGDFTLDIPQRIVIGNHIINIITVDIFETSPSKRASKVWKINESDLTGTNS